MCGPQRPKFGGFWILGILGILGILDFGFWILGILDFGFWGFWILDFGVWGFWILDFVTNFGFYIRRRRLCTPNRVGGLENWKVTFLCCFFDCCIFFLNFAEFNMSSLRTWGCCASLAALIPASSLEGNWSLLLGHWTDPRNATLGPWIAEVLCQDVSRFTLFHFRGQMFFPSTVCIISVYIYIIYIYIYV